MSSTRRKATKEKGVYELISDVRKHNNKPDICFYIVFKIEHKLIWEKIGWASEGYSIKLASNIRSERLRSIRHGEDIPQQKKKVPTFKEIADTYLKWSKENKNRAGIEDQSRYDNHLKQFDDKRLDEISPFDLEKMKADMAKAEMAPKTISHCLGLIRSMFNKAADWNLYVGPNPVKKIKMPVIQNARDRFLSYEEAEILLKELRHNIRFKNEYKELENPKLHDMALLSLHTGARASEIFNLKPHDISFENGLIVLRDTKNTETRYAPMTDAVREMLKNRIKLFPGSYVFIDEDGEKIKEVSNAFDKVIERLEFNKGVTDPRQKIVFHSLRHTFASWLAIQGTPLYTIAKLMGHKSIAMSERYSHLSPDHKKNAVNNLELAFKRNKKTKEAKTKHSGG